MNYVYHLNMDGTCTLYQVDSKASLDKICRIINEEQCKALIAELVVEHGLHVDYSFNETAQYNVYVTLNNGDVQFICTVTSGYDADALMTHFD